MTRAIRRPGLAAVLVVLLGAVVSSRCTRSESSGATATPPTIRIVTGPPGLTFGPLGEALATAYSRALPDRRFEAIPTPGTGTNLQLLQAGNAELAFSVANIAYAAYGGLDAEFRPSANNLRTMAVLHPSSVHILVPATSTARTVSDLRGRVAVGTPGSGFTAKMLMQQFVRPDRLILDETLPLSETPDALSSGKITAAVIVSADPTDVVTRATAKGARLIPIAALDIQRLRTDYPVLRPGTIAAGTYPGEGEAVATLLVDVLLVTRADLEDELVRRLTSTLFDILPDLASQFPYLALMNMQRAPASPIPLHPGAALFYRERELTR
jgi:TRAP transporter TAXI family solute receptor